MPNPLQTLTQVTDGSVPTQTSFFNPFYGAAQSLVSAVGGSPDANNGNPVHVRSHATGLHSFTNARGVSTNPGTNPTGLGSFAAANTTVPAGTRLLVTSLFTDATGSSALVQINSSVSVAELRTANAQMYFGLPLVLDAADVLNTPLHTAFFGYTVVLDSAVTPKHVNVNNSGGSYTVTSGKTFWVYGCINCGGAQNTFNRLLINGSNPILAAYAGNNAGGTDNAWDITSGSALWGQAPIPVQAGQVLSASSAGLLFVFGVEV